MPTNSGANGFSWVAALVTWGLVALGWWVTHRSAIARDRERDLLKGIRDLVDEARALLGKTKELGLRYHMKDRDLEVERALRFELQALAYKLNSLYPLVRKFSGDPKRLVVAYRRAASLDHFAEEHSGPLTPDADQLAEIEASAFELAAFLDRVSVNTLLTPPEAVLPA